MADHRRRRYLVEARFQLRWAALIALVGGGTGAVMGAAVWVAIDEQQAVHKSAIVAQRDLKEATQNVSILLMSLPDTAAPEVAALEERVKAANDTFVAAQQAYVTAGEFATWVRWGLVAFVLLLAAALFGWGILLTHRIAGPLFVIRRALNAHARGEPFKHGSLRRNDEFRDVFEALQKALLASTQAAGDGSEVES